MFGKVLLLSRFYRLAIFFLAMALAVFIVQKVAYAATTQYFNGQVKINNVKMSPYISAINGGTNENTCMASFCRAHI